MPSEGSNEPSSHSKMKASVATKTESSSLQSKKEAVLDAYRNLQSIEDSIMNLRDDLRIAEEDTTEPLGSGTSSRYKRSRKPLVKDFSGSDILERMDMHKVSMGVRKRLWFVILCAVAFAVGASFLSTVILNGHRAEAILLFQSTPAAVDTLGVFSRSVTRETAAEMVRTPRNFEQLREILGLEQTADQLTEMVDIQLRRASNLIRIVATANDPALAQNLANGLAEVAVIDSKKRYEQTASQAYDYLKQEVALSQKKLDEVGREFAQFKAQEGMVALDAGSTNAIEDIADLQDAYQSASVDYESKFVQFENLQQEVDELPDRIVSVEYEESPLKSRIANREMALLEARTRYGPENPKVLLLEEELRQLRIAIREQNFDEARQRVYENNFAKEQLKLELLRLKGQVRAAEQKRDSLYAQLQEDEEGIQAIPQVQMQYQRLSQALSQAQDEHNELLNSLRIAEGQMEMGRSDVALYQQATSTSSSESVFARFLPTFGFLFGALFALAFVITAEAKDKRIRIPEQLKKNYNVPHILSIPELRRLNLRNTEDKTLFYVRNLSERLKAFAPQGRFQSVCFTGTSVGEGKSLIAYHFATYQNRLGKKAAYLHFDQNANPFIRREPKPKSRISDYLRGKAEFSEIIASGELVDILEAGHDPEMKELLSSESMKKLWEELGKEYDVIVVDAPGIIEDDCAINLAEQCDTSLLVVNSRKTNKSSVDACLNELDERKIEPTGLILNQIKRGYVEDPRIQTQMGQEGLWGSKKKRQLGDDEC